jgi:hypothetical protein
MAITYTWDVQSIDVISEYNTNTNVVSRVVWNCTADDGTNQKQMTGVQDLNIANIDPESFVPYESVTKEQILEWVKVWVNVPAVERSLIPNTFTQHFTSDPTGGISTGTNSGG